MQKQPKEVIPTHDYKITYKHQELEQYKHLTHELRRAPYITKIFQKFQCPLKNQNENITNLSPPSFSQ